MGGIMKGIIVFFAILPYLAHGQIVGNPFEFVPEVRVHGGLSVPQRTEQPNVGREGLAGLGWSAGASLYLRSTSVDGGAVAVVSYGDYNAEVHIGYPRLQLFRIEVGAFTDFDFVQNKLILLGTVGKAFQYASIHNNAIGGSVGIAYEAVKRYGVFGRYSYYNLGRNTLGLWEAGVQLRMF
jgi:hypothetical protein